MKMGWRRLVCVENAKSENRSGTHRDEYTVPSIRKMNEILVPSMNALMQLERSGSHIGKDDS